MIIFNHYTGSAMLNNALQTIEAITELDHVSQITIEMLTAIFEEKDLSKLYPRLKNYTMLFTKNGPLHNDKKNGIRIYESLMKALLEGFETEGQHQCEISGLYFKKTFDQIYSDVLRELGISPEDKDTSINRVWWPLLGSLKDAQALPQAKFSIRIHPICIAMMQFLPLSCIIHKVKRADKIEARILMVDSINFNFTREFIKDNVKKIDARIGLTPIKSKIENVELSKEDYLIRALSIYTEMKYDYKDMTDLNLWSFTNLGNGPYCTVERIPSVLFQKLLFLYENIQTSNDLIKILTTKWNNNFLEKLENNEDCYLLYPRQNYEGVGVAFFEKYHQLIQNNANLEFAGYIAGLVDKYLPEKQWKFFAKSDCYNKPEYSNELYSILLKAAENGEWNIMLHCQILDESNKIPIKNTFYLIQKMIHFYYLKKHFKDKPQNVDIKSSTSLKLCAYFIRLIENEINKERIIRGLTDRQHYQKTSIENIIIRSAETVDLNSFYASIYENGLRKPFGLFDLLRLYFISKEQLVLSDAELPDAPPLPLLNKFELFAIGYMDYYFEKYKASDDKLPLIKFQNHVLKKFPKSNSEFYYWLNEVLTNIAQFNGPSISVEELLADEAGHPNMAFARFAINFFLTKYSKKIAHTV